MILAQHWKCPACGWAMTTQAGFTGATCSRCGGEMEEYHPDWAVMTEEDEERFEKEAVA